jgi:hypothetical protein
MAEIILSGLHVTGRADDTLRLAVDEPGGWFEVTGLPALRWAEKVLAAPEWKHLANVPCFCEVRVTADQGSLRAMICDGDQPPFGGAAPPPAAPGLHLVAEGEKSPATQLSAGQRLWLWSEGVALTISLTASARPVRVIFAEGDEPPFDTGQGEVIQPGQTLSQTMARNKRLWFLGLT